MIFFAARFQWEASAHAEPDLDLAIAGRHAARALTPAVVPLGAGQVACHAAASATAAAGDVEVLVMRSENGPDARATAVANDLLGRYAARGRRALDELPHPWTALIVDRARRVVTLASDRFAIAPVHYVLDGETLWLSSDIDVLAARPGANPVLDQQATYDYVFFHCIPAPRTIYRGISKLPPATALTWLDGDLTLERWWQPRFAANGDVAPDAQALLESLSQAVASRDDTTTGAFLSGGLDSSSVAGAMTRHRPAAPTFTIGFSAAGYDERAYARVAAEAFGTTHYEYEVTPADIADGLLEIAAFQGEPFGNSSVIPTLYCARLARDHGMQALLAGDGGDELFGGNERYVTQRVFERYFDVPGVARAALETGYRLLPFLGRLPVAGKGQRYIEQAKMGLPDRLQSYNFLNRFAPDTVFAPDWLDGVDTGLPWQAWRERYRDAGDIDSLPAMLYLDWKFTLADNDLVKVNSMCELAGIDVRYPMLDERVVDYSLTVPPAAMNPNGQLRGFYKSAMQGFLPDQILHKSKHGFGLPFGVWMREDARLNEMAVSALNGFAGRGIVHRPFIDEALRLLNEDAAGYYGELIWILMVLELWLGERRL